MTPAPVLADRLAELIRRLDSAAAQATACAAQLRALAAAPAPEAGPCRVFACDATGQFVVLRDVETLAGARLDREIASFADALAWANQRLAALGASQTVARRYADLFPAAAP